MVEIYAVNIREHLDEKDIQSMLDWISLDKRKKIERYRLKDDLLRSLYGEAIVRWKIINDLGISNSHIVFGSNSYGKPYIKGNVDFEFNISHSGDWIICAFGQEAVGADIETISGDHCNLAEHYFSDKEYNILKQKIDKQRYFYILWTLKESYIKWKGKGLSIPLDSFSIMESSEGFYVVCGDEVQEVIFSQGELDEKHIYSICSNEKIKNEINILHMKDINSL